MFNIISYEGNVNLNHSDHYTPIRMSKIRKSSNTKCWQGCNETGTQWGTADGNIKW